MIASLAAADPLSTGFATRNAREGLIRLWEATLEHLPYLALGVVVLILTWLGAALLSRIAAVVAGRMGVRESLIDLIRSLLYAGVWAGGILAAATVVFPSLSPGRLVGTLGLTSIAVGFAFKDIFENFFAGVLILWRFPFERGDFIEIDGISARVERVELRMTRLRKPDGELVLLPNGRVLKSMVGVLTNSAARRASLVVGLPYGADMGRAFAVIREAVEGCDSRYGQSKVEVLAREFGASSVDVEVAWWCKSSPPDVRTSRSEVLVAIHAALDEAGIDIPYPHRTVLLHEQAALV